MKILFISEYGEALPMAMHSARKGAQVKLFTHYKVRTGNGLVNKSVDPIEDAKDSELAVITSPRLFDYHKKVGKWCPTIGGSRFEYQLNTDEYLCKTLYKIGGVTLGESPSENKHKLIAGGWFGKGGFRYPCVIGHIESGLLEGGKGLEVDGVGVCVTSDVKRKLFSTTLQPLSHSLTINHFCGFVSVEFTHDGVSAYPQRVQAGLDSFLIPATMEITSASLPMIFQGLVSKRIKTSDIRPEFGISIGISIPPYPYKADIVPQPELDGYCPQNDKHIWLYDVTKDNGAIKCAGHIGMLGYVTARGTSMFEARNRAYRTIKNLTIPHLQYRSDIGEGFQATLRLLS